MDGFIEVGQASRRVRARRARSFHLGMSIAFLVTAFAGFAPTYFLRGLSHRPPLRPMLHVHGAAFTAWLVLLVVQATLVRAHRLDWHRRLGVLGAALATAMVPLGVMAALESARLGAAAGNAKAFRFLVFPLGQVAMFGVLFVAAIWQRRRPEIHRRLIILATTALMPPAIARLIGRSGVPALSLSMLFVVAAMVHDWRSRGRVHPIYIWAVAAFLASGPLRLALAQSPAWSALARLLTQ